MMALTAPPLHIVAVGLHGLRYLFEALAPEYRRNVQITLLERAYHDAVVEINALCTRGTVDAVVAAGSNGDYLRQHLGLPVILVKVSGLDVMQGLVQAKGVSERVAIVMYGSVPAELSDFVRVLDLPVQLHCYETEADARQCVLQLKREGVEAVVAPGLVVDLAKADGLHGILLYSQRLVREAIEDAVEAARLSRIELARRERVNTILEKLRDAVVAVDVDDRIEVVNPAMVALLEQPAHKLIGRKLGHVSEDLSLAKTLQTQKVETEQIQQVGNRTIVMTRLPLLEHGELVGAVLICQDSALIQRLDHSLRSNRSVQSKHTRYRLSNLLGQHDSIVRLRALGLACAKHDASVLIFGESGTGKEILAQGIHAESGRREQPFIAVNCAAFPESLLESELFGYVDGAFTGAARGGKMGVFEAAHTGTLFLDEVGEMPISLQTRLLRVLQERMVTRIGSVMPTPVNVRVIAATHRNLEAEIGEGRFRQDLYYRLNILQLSIPPLRERVEDLPLLVEELLERVAHRIGTEPDGIDTLIPALLKNTLHYDWPGNVRELENVIERMVMMVFALPDFSPGTLLLDILPAACVKGLSKDAGLKTFRQRLETSQIKQALDACGGDQNAAATALGISRTTLWRRLKQERT
ncbi:propionate catabolism operon regulatory protein PrpR [Pusillimonas sp. DMV24BSW_D]|uniref:propionate catabolism operon regulatory protein PrpR n=1 Tax=Neopusillimonas aestuarii TaxID=2716226 RepID=UPI00140951B3|nr:propionate catabolism operon regulatory protein PrpR [Pusillimonas sp. DMV24BSW_D]QIM47899.1 propionate catabolism operon regulatory protein PrpR [Pusillimonas sp. DMV24BSW_D]